MVYVNLLVDEIITIITFMISISFILDHKILKNIFWTTSVRDKRMIYFFTLAEIVVEFSDVPTLLIMVVLNP